VTNLDRATMKALLLHETHKPGRHQMNGFLRETANMLRTATRVVTRARSLTPHPVWKS
jgi:hypothetical protein